ncbi:MAG: metal-dependent hydrolase [Anaerolineaceae bacterium]
MKTFVDRIQKDASRISFGSYISLLSTQIVILLVMVSGDILVASGRPDWVPQHIWALTDVPVHILLGILVSIPLIVQNGWNRQTLLRLMLAGLAAMLIDLDHFMAAGSFSLFAATHLDYRPATHSLAFALLCFLIIWLITRNIRDGLLVFMALASHVVRDASGGGTPFLLFPFEVSQIPVWIYYAAELGLSLAAWMAAGVQFIARDRQQSDPTVQHPILPF